MVTFDDVARIALALPQTEEITSYGNVSWAVKSGGSGSKSKAAEGLAQLAQLISKREPPPARQKSLIGSLLKRNA